VVKSYAIYSPQAEMTEIVQSQSVLVLMAIQLKPQTARMRRFYELGAPISTAASSRGNA
jgi:hypothetical protein